MLRRVVAAAAVVGLSTLLASVVALTTVGHGLGSDPAVRAFTCASEPRPKARARHASIPGRGHTGTLKGFRLGPLDFPCPARQSGRMEDASPRYVSHRESGNSNAVYDPGSTRRLSARRARPAPRQTPARGGFSPPRPHPRPPTPCLPVRRE